MLTRQMVENFLVNKLHLPDWKLIEADSKYKLVEKIVLAFQQHIYFQSVTSSAAESSQRHCPTPQEAIEWVVLDGEQNKGNGGCCIHTNYVLVLILQNLGLDAFLIGADEWLLQHLNNSHILVIWRANAKEVYAIDVGYPRPIPYLIPLHNLPFEGKVGGFRFTMTLNKESGNFERTLYDGCPGYGQFKESEKEPRKEYYFSSSLTPRPFSHFDAVMTTLLVDADSFMLRALRMSRLTRVESPEDFDYVLALRKSIVVGSRTEYSRTVYETYAEMLPAVLKHFPKMDRETLRIALEKYDGFEQEKEKELFDPRTNPSVISSQ